MCPTVPLNLIEPPPVADKKVLEVCDVYTSSDAGKMQKEVVYGTI